MRSQQVSARTTALVDSYRWLAPAALVVSALCRVAVSVLLPTGLNMIDLRVYTFGAASLTQGKLYSYALTESTGGLTLPFTYPPFAAIVFFPLHLVSFPVLAVVWEVATIAALWAAIRVSLHLLLGERADEPRWRSAAMVWSAVAVWLEPVRTTLDFGQVNVFLMLAVLLAARSKRWWVAGGLVGFAAGVKLTPAITGLYFLVRRNVAAAVFSAGAFACTVALSFALAPAEVREYFGGLVMETSRIGEPETAGNQSLRGLLTRVTHDDVGMGLIWLIAAGVTVLLCLLAWRGLSSGDRLGQLLVAQLLGLMLSPVSWSHHWVWLIPVVLWLVHGPLAHTVIAQFTAVACVVTQAGIVQLAVAMQRPTGPGHSHPLVVGTVGAVYPAAAVAILLLMAAGPQAIRKATSSRSPAVAPPNDTTGSDPIAEGGG